ncbi:MAG: hypothetical protein QW506_06325 [Thermoproteota archaeon]
MVNPKVRERLIDSLNYLRKMDFFKDYSDLTSEGILNKMLCNEINYASSWDYEEPDIFSLHGAQELIPYGFYLQRSIEEKPERWMEISNFEIDLDLIPFDTRRVTVELSETWIDDSMGPAILRRLARISRGVFQPTNVSGKWLIRPRERRGWSVQEVSFDFKGEGRSIRIVLQEDYLVSLGLGELNEMIRDTGYQYYSLDTSKTYGDRIVMVVLTEEEKEKLVKERGWEFGPLSELVTTS